MRNLRRPGVGSGSDPAQGYGYVHEAGRRATTVRVCCHGNDARRAIPQRGLPRRSAGRTNPRGAVYGLRAGDAGASRQVTVWRHGSGKAPRAVHRHGGVRSGGAGAHVCTAVPAGNGISAGRLRAVIVGCGDLSPLFVWHWLCQCIFATRGFFMAETKDWRINTVVVMAVILSSEGSGRGRGDSSPRSRMTVIDSRRLPLVIGARGNTGKASATRREVSGDKSPYSNPQSRRDMNNCTMYQNSRASEANKAKEAATCCPMR